MGLNLGLGLGINSGGKAYTFLPQTRTLLNSLTGVYSLARKKQIDLMIRSLVTAGVWAKLDVLQMYAAPTAADAVVNWKSPGTYNATLVNSPPLEADRGITGDGASSYINMKFNTSTGVNFTQDSNSFGFYSRTQDFIGAEIGLANTWIIFSNGTNLTARINRGTTLSVANNTTLGFVVASRTSANDVAIYKNGASILTNNAYASAALLNSEVFVLANSSSGTPVLHTTKQGAAAFAGAGLTAGEASAFNTALETYLDYIGAGVIA